MNRCYRLVWNERAQRWVAAPESARGRGKRKAVLAAGAFIAAIPAWALDAGALPQGGTVVQGSATLTQAPNALTVTQATQRAVIDWNRFEVGGNAVVRYAQPSSGSVVLNRVVGSDPSRILGRIEANGQVFLVNPNGVLFGAGAQVDVGGLVASTLDIADADFMGGRLRFSGTAGAAVRNEGRLSAAAGGFVALLGAQVDNQGTVSARLGSIALAAGNAVTLDFAGDGLLRLQVDAGAVKAQADNGGLLVADGGSVLMSARAADALAGAVVNNSGVVQARTLVEREGRILLLADAQGGSTRVAGTLDASAPQGGNGGFIETSAAQVQVGAGARITTAAGNGRSGTWLVDPTDFTVSAGSAAQTASGIGASTLSAALQNTSVALATNAAGGDLGDLRVNAAVSWSAATTLTLNADHNLYLSAPIRATGNGAGLVLSAINDYLGGGITLSGTGASLNISGANVYVQAPVTVNGAGAAFTLNGDAYTLIRSLGQFQSFINLDPTGFYALAQDLGGAGFSASVVPSFSGTLTGLGHVITGLTINAAGADQVGLIGTSSGHISDIGLVNAHVTGRNEVGTLVGRNNGAISGSFASGLVVNGGTGVGGLAGSSSGSVREAYATGSISGSSAVGGVVGSNTGTVRETYGSVAGALGGVIGSNTGGFTPFGENFYDTGGAGAGAVSGTFLTSAQMKQSASFIAAFDLATQGGSSASWRLYESRTTPMLRAFMSPVTVTVNDTSKAYDGGTTFTGVTYALSDASANPSLVLGTPSYSSASKNVGDYVLSANGQLYSTQQGYDLSFVSGTGSITPRAISFTGTLAASKVYDGNLNVAVTGATLSGVLGADLVTLTQSGLFLDKNAGSGKTVNYTSALSGTGAANYTLVSGSGSFSSGSITPRAVDITGSVAAGKIYDGGTLATVSGGTVVGANVVAGDHVSVSGQSGAFADKNVGAGKAVTVFTTLGGSDAGNYTANDAVASAAITARTLVVSGTTAASKVYDGNRSATVSGGALDMSNVVAGDLVSLAGQSGQFGDQNAGVNKTVTIVNTLGGAGAGNYVASNSTAMASITPRPLTVNGSSAQDKVYDGSTAAIVTGGLLDTSNVVAGDTVSLVGQSGQFASRNVGAGMAVAIANTLSNGNYAASSSPVAASITPRTLTIVGSTAQDKVYDGSTAATVVGGSVDASNVVAGDLVSVAAQSGSFSDAHAQAGKNVTVVSTLGGAAAGNYVAANAAATATITPRPLAVSGTAAQDKVYDGDTAAVVGGGMLGLGNVVGGDDVSLAGQSGSFADRNAGAGKSVTVVNTLGGASAADYTAPDVLVTASITPRALAVNGSAAQDKVYDGSRVATVTGGVLDTSNLVAGDVVSLAGQSGLFASKNVGTQAVTVDSTLTGAAAGNYVATPVSVNATISARALDIGGTLGASKVYDGTLGVAVTGGALVGVVGSEQVVLAQSGLFVDRNAGSGKTVNYTSSLSGADAGNYTLAAGSGSLSSGIITPRTLTVSGSAALDKAYDGSVAATVVSGAIDTGNVVAGDSVFLAGQAGSFADKNVGMGKAVTVVNALAGADAGNYVVADGSATASISARLLTVGGTLTAAKSYDGTLGVVVGGGSLVGVLAGEQVVLSQSGTFIDKNVGSGKTVNTTGSLSGADAGNYALASASGVLFTGVITPRTLTVGGTTVAANKVYDGGTGAGVSGGTLVGAVAGDLVALSQSGAFADKNVGTGKAVTVTNALTGADAANYQLSAAAAPGPTADITPAPLAVTGTTAASKVYDGTVAASVSGGALGGVLAGDDVQLHQGGVFADKNAGLGKPVTVTNALTGADAANYRLDPVVWPAPRADIAPLALTMSGAAALDKVYDGTTTAALTGSLQGVLPGDSVVLNETGAFADKNVGTGKPVAITRWLIGVDSGNYTVPASASAVADIAPKTLTLSGSTAASKVYDGTTTASVAGTSLNGVVAGDAVTLSQSASFADKNAGTGKAVTVVNGLGGGDAGNYLLASPSQNLSADITPLPLFAVSASAASKVYDGTTAATVTAWLNDVIAGDQVVARDTGATFADKNVGIAKPVSYRLALAGADAANYLLVSTYAGPATADITPAPLTVTGTTAASKVYDGRENATVSGGTLHGVIAGDDVSLSQSGFFLGSFVGTTDVSVYNTLQGADRDNYIVGDNHVKAAITPATLTLGSVQVQDKVYDGSTSVHLTGSVVGLLPGDFVSLSANPASAFSDKNVGTGKPVAYTVDLSGYLAVNYVLANPSGHSTASITPAPLTLNGAVALNKVYDGTVVASLGNRGTLGGVIAGDSVALSHQGASFADRNVGAGKAVTVSSTLSGADAGNYRVADATLSADITPATLTLTGAHAAGKVYDGSTAATVTGGALGGVLGGDQVTLAGLSGAFDDRHVGVGKAVAVTGTLGGVDAGNYVVAGAVARADITPRPLDVTASASNKVYDGTTAASLGAGILANVVPGDDVSLGATGSFADKRVGVAKPVVGVSLVGADSGDYRVSSISASADITPAPLSVVGTVAADRTYDGTVSATLSGGTLVGVMPGDVVTLTQSGAFTDKNIALWPTPKTVNVTSSVSGADSGNYLLAGATATTTAFIYPALLTVSGTTASSKVYDGTTAATVGGGQLHGVVAGDVVLLSQSGAFLDPHAATGQPVNYTNTLSGADAFNYALGSSFVGWTRADITPAPLQVIGTVAQNKVYDGGTSATVGGGHLVGMIGADSVTLQSQSGAFSDKNVGTAKVVTVFSELGGADFRNYYVAGGTTALADITPATATLWGAVAQNKVYDGSTQASVSALGIGGVSPGDDLAVLFSGAFADKNVGTGKTVAYTGTLSGTSAGNYVLAGGSGSTTASIVPAMLSVGGTSAGSKVYDGTVAATLVPGRLYGVIGADDVQLSQSGAFVDKNAQRGKVVNVVSTLSGLDAGNYVVAPTTVHADITPAPLQLTGTMAQDKVYDGSTAATAAGGRLSGVLAGDSVAVGAQAGAFSDRNAGIGKVVFVSTTLVGADAGNYTVPQVVSSADITPAPLTLSGTTALSKTYDGTTAAALNGGTLNGLLGGDSVALAQTGAFADKNAGLGKTVTFSSTLSGAQAGNYVLANPGGSTTADITPAPLAVSGTLASGKVYDGSTGVALSGGVLAGVVPGDSVLLVQSGAFLDKNVGRDKPVSVTATLGGPDGGNYALASLASVRADITPAPLVVTGPGTANDKVYDGGTAATGQGGSFEGLMAGDQVTVLRTGQFGDPHVGSGKPVTWTDVALGGPDAGNYRPSLRPGDAATAAITPAPLAVTLNDDTRPVGATPYAGGNGLHLGGLMGADNASVLQGSLVYGGSAQGADQPGLYTLTGSGLFAQDYTLQWVAGRLTLLPAQPLARSSTGELPVPRLPAATSPAVLAALTAESPAREDAPCVAALRARDGSVLLCVAGSGAADPGR